MPKPVKPAGPRLCPGDEDGPCDYQAVVNIDDGSTSSSEEIVSRKSSKDAWKDDPDHPKHAGRGNRAPRWQRSTPSSSRSGNSSRNGWSSNGSRGNSSNNNNNNNNNNSNSNNNNSSSNKPLGNGLHPTTDAAAVSNFGWGAAPARSGGRGNGGGGWTTVGRTAYARRAPASVAMSTSRASTTGDPAPAPAPAPQRRSEFRCQYCDTLCVEPENTKPYPFPEPKDDMLTSVGLIDWADYDDDD